MDLYLFICVLDIFLQVNIRYWIDGVEKGLLSAVTAKFGPYPLFEKKSRKLPVVSTDPLNGCSELSSKVSVPRTRHLVCFPFFFFGKGWRDGRYRSLRVYNAQKLDVKA